MGLSLCGGKFQAYNADHNEEDRQDADHFAGVFEEDDSAGYRANGSDSRPDSIGCAQRDRFHGLRKGEEAQADKQDGNDTRNEFCEPI